MRIKLWVHLWDFIRSLTGRGLSLEWIQALTLYTSFIVLPFAGSIPATEVLTTDLKLVCVGFWIGEIDTHVFIPFFFEWITEFKVLTSTFISIGISSAFAKRNSIAGISSNSCRLDVYEFRFIWCWYATAVYDGDIVRAFSHSNFYLARFRTHQVCSCNFNIVETSLKKDMR